MVMNCLKIICSFLCVIFMFLIGMWNLIYGWGLTPHSWVVIISTFIINFIILMIMEVIKALK